ncbi:acyl carrier protein [Priestia megaterium]
MYVQDLLSKLLAFNSPELPEIHQGFFDMGMESVMAEQFRSLLEQTFKIEISDTAVFDYPNISELSCYILESIPFLELESQSLHFHDSQKENSLLEDIALLDSNNLNEVHEMPLEEVVDELKALLNE